MNKEDIKELARQSMLETIKNNLDSTMIFMYIKSLEDRIQKAIEYLESYNTDFKNTRFGEAPISLRELGDLLDILKGEDNENN